MCGLEFLSCNRLGIFTSSSFCMGLPMINHFPCYIDSSHSWHVASDWGAELFVRRLASSVWTRWKITVDLLLTSITVLTMRQCKKINTSFTGKGFIHVRFSMMEGPCKNEDLCKLSTLTYYRNIFVICTLIGWTQIRIFILYIYANVFAINLYFCIMLDI